MQLSSSMEQWLAECPRKVPASLPENFQNHENVPLHYMLSVTSNKKVL